MSLVLARTGEHQLQRSDFVPTNGESFLTLPRDSGSRAKSVNAGDGGIKALTNAFSLPWLVRRAQTAFGLDKADNAVEALAFPEIGHHKRPFAAHPPGVGVHFLQRCADMRREVDLVDDEKVRSGDARATLRGNLVARGY